jgi:hypothetical protein
MKFLRKSNTRLLMAPGRNHRRLPSEHKLIWPKAVPVTISTEHSSVSSGKKFLCQFQRFR